MICACRIDGDLHVVRLHERALVGAVGHDARLGVGEIALRLRLRLRALDIRDRRRFAARLVARLGFFLRALIEQRQRLGRFGLCLRSRFGFERRLRLANLGQPPVATCKLLGKLVAAPSGAVLGVFLCVGLFRASQKLGHLLLELLLGLAHPLVAHRLVLGGVGLDLGAVNGDVPELAEARLPAQLQHLREQARERGQMLLAERRDAVVVRVLVARQHPKRYVLVRRSLDLARRRLAHARTRTAAALPSSPGRNLLALGRPSPRTPRGWRSSPGPTRRPG